MLLNEPDPFVPFEFKRQVLVRPKKELVWASVATCICLIGTVCPIAGVLCEALSRYASDDPHILHEIAIACLLLTAPLLLLGGWLIYQVTRKR